MPNDKPDLQCRWRFEQLCFIKLNSFFHVDIVSLEFISGY